MRGRSIHPRAVERNRCPFVQVYRKRAQLLLLDSFCKPQPIERYHFSESAAVRMLHRHKRYRRALSLRARVERVGIHKTIIREHVIGPNMEDDCDLAMRFPLSSVL